MLKPTQVGRFVQSLEEGAEANRDLFINPFENRSLISYFDRVIEWHGYIRFLGLPQLRDNPDMPIERLYVQPMVSSDLIDPDIDPLKWPECRSVFDAMLRSPRMVLLGDPGSGKSTLVSWLARQFATSEETKWTSNFGRLIPLPMVLREMSIDMGTKWDGLLESFLSRPLARPLKDGGALSALLETGQAILMLDGLDEIGDERVRRCLHDAFIEGITRFPKCRWLLTSRIVGYASVPFHLIPVDRNVAGRNQKRRSPKPNGKVETFFPVADLFFAAPFSDGQVEEFIKNWYRQRESADELRTEGAKNLLDAVHAHGDTTRLARVPNLLTMMALIFRVRARLPHGRALLYNEISQAYLETIDDFRRLYGPSYSFTQKKRWLARVAFEMQKRRSRAGNLNADPREILVGKPELRKWIMAAMTESGRGADETAVEEFVDYIGRRSGLLLPRGMNEFAFMHLSFQEYFAACYLAEIVTSPAWIRDTVANGMPSHADLGNFATATAWHETLVLLFELLADRPGWADEVAPTVFGDFRRMAVTSKSEAATLLLASISVDPHAGLSKSLREAAWRECWRIYVAADSSPHRSSSLARALLNAELDDLNGVWDAFEEVAALAEVEEFSLSGVLTFTDLKRLCAFKSLRMANISHTSVDSLVGASEINGLQSLLIHGCKKLRSLDGLELARHLKLLHMGACNQITDLSALGNLVGLESLSVVDVAGDWSFLAKLPQLSRIMIDFTQVRLLPTTLLSRLDELFLRGCKLETITSDVIELLIGEGLSHRRNIYFAEDNFANETPGIHFARTEFDDNFSAIETPGAPE